jgi:hypothetical protein
LRMGWHMRSSPVLPLITLVFSGPKNRISGTLLKLRFPLGDNSLRTHFEDVAVRNKTDLIGV